MTNRTTTHGTSPALAHHVEARRLELGLSVTDMVERSGLSAPGLKHVRDGHRRNYQHKVKVGVARALRWTPDSIDSILAGGEPTPLERAVQPSTTPGPAELAVRLEETAARLDEAVGRLERLEHLADTLAPQIPANAEELARLLARLDDLARAVLPSPAGQTPDALDLMPGLAP